MPARAVRLTIDLNALAANYGVLRAAAAGAETAPVLKADGYGLGAGRVGRRLWREGARSFFVARLGEGEALREALGPGRPATIYVLDGLTTGSAAALKASGLTPVLMTADQAQAALALEPDAAPPFALHVDTGMHRQGVSVAEAAGLANRLPVNLVMSHLGSAAEAGDPRNRAQLQSFRDARALFPHALASLAASAGTFLGPDYRFEMVRPGVSLYGGGPEERPDARLRAVATLEAPILQVRDVPAGALIGYGSAARAERDLRIAIVAAGYADGVIRSGRGKGYAWAGGARRRLLIVTMNMVAIEIGDAALEPGDMVELLGPNALLDDQAAAAGSVAHECLTRLSAVTERRYLGED
jgi:alanine racemase